MRRLYVEKGNHQFEEMREKAQYIAENAGMTSWRFLAASSFFDQTPVYARRKYYFEHDPLRIEVFQLEFVTGGRVYDPSIHISLRKTEGNPVVNFFSPFVDTYSWSRNLGGSFNRIPGVIETIIEDDKLRRCMFQQVDRLYPVFKMLVDEKKMTSEEIRAMPVEEFDRILKQYSPDAKR